MKRPIAICAVLAFSLLVAATGCGRDGGADTKPKPPTTVASPPAAPAAHVAGDNYKVDTSATCTGQDCTATVRLEATGGYHINDSYPYKFKADSADGVSYKTTDAAFSKDSGDFNKQSEKVALVTVRFTATKATKVTGTFKMSVCSEANCQIEQASLAIDASPTS